MLWGIYVSLTGVDSGGFYDGVTEAVNICVTSGAGITVGFVDLTVSFRPPFGLGHSDPFSVI